MLSKPSDEVLDGVKTACVAEGFGTPSEIGVLLPCNAVVRESNGDVILEVMVEVMVETTDPDPMAHISGSDDVAPIAADAPRLVRYALDRLDGLD